MQDRDLDGGGVFQIWLVEVRTFGKLVGNDANGAGVSHAFHTASKKGCEKYDGSVESTTAGAWIKSIDNPSPAKRV